MMGYHQNRLSQRGFSLLETLIAAILLAVGLLSIAALQAKALQASHNSYQRSVAIAQAHDAVERLWAGICVLDTTVVGKIETDWQTAHSNTAGMTDWEGEIDDTNAPTYVITIEWGNNRLENADTSFTYTTILPDSASITGCSSS